MLGNFLIFLTGAMVGAIIGALVYRNNAKKAEDALVDATAELKRLREIERAAGAAYGYLWHVNNEPGAPAQFDPEAAAYLARRILRDLLTSEQRGKGITDARHEMSGCKIPPPGWRCTRQVGHTGPCAAINDLPSSGGEKL